MGRISFAPIVEYVCGAIDSIKEGQANRKRLVVRRHDYVDEPYDPDGNKWHQIFYMNFHEGPWSDRCEANRRLFSASHKTAHAIESDPVLREPWVARYAVYLASLPEGTKEHYKFYGYVYSTIYAQMRSELNL